MNISHHANEETLARFGAGMLHPGPALVVRTHLSLCASCRERAAKYEAVGGAMLEELAPVEMQADALERTFASIDRPREKAADARMEADSGPRGIVLPEPLRGCKIGSWRWIAPGVRIAAVDMKDENVFLMKVGPGKSLLKHSHAGAEYVCVLAGAFSDQTGRYGPGDMSQAGPELEHAPVVEAGGDCICLLAIEGKLRFGGFFPRLLQPILGL